MFCFTCSLSCSVWRPGCGRDPGFWGNVTAWAAVAPLALARNVETFIVYCCRAPGLVVWFSVLPGTGLVDLATELEWEDAKEV